MGLFGAVIRISLFSRKPGMGFLLRAAGRLRSDDLPLTRRLLCQLSYGSGTGILHACPVAGFPKKPARQRRKTGRFFGGERAIDRIRTGDLRITRALLCQLSYDGEDRSGMRNGGWAMRAQECLSRDRFMPPIANDLPFGNPAFRMWPRGPSCFDGIRTRITPKTGHPDRLNDEAMLRIRCWRGGSVQATEVQACALTIVPLRPNMAAGGWRR